VGGNVGTTPISKQDKVVVYMLIAHIARVTYPHHPYGGLEQHVYHLTQHLARLGHAVHLYTAPPTLKPEDFVWHENVCHHFVKYDTLPLRPGSIPARLTNYPLFAYRTARRAAKLSPKPAIVHAHGLAAIGYSRKLFPDTPLVLNPHGMEEFKVTKRAKQLAYLPFRALLRRAARTANAVIATDNTLIPEVERYLHVPTAKIALIPNALDLEKWDNLPLKPNLNLAPFTLLSVGRLEANKGFDIMLKALAQIKTRLPSGWQWLVVGAGSQRQTLEQTTRQTNLSENVRWLGAVDDSTLHTLYCKADLFVHPTLYEGSSLVTLEALGHNLPVVASRTGGLPDKIIESGVNQNGRLCPPADSTALARTLLEVCALPAATRRQWGHNGRKLVEQKFSWQAAARRTGQLYEELHGQLHSTR
jgi:glycogen synthase